MAVLAPGALFLAALSTMSLMRLAAGRRAVIASGAMLQLGGFVGSVIGFLLTNVFDVFGSTHPDC